MAGLAYVRPSLGLQGGSEYQPFITLPEAPGAVFNQGDFLQVITTGSLVFPTPAGSLISFQPTSAPTIGSTTRSGEAQHTLFAWYTLTGSGGQGVIESLPYSIGPVVNSSGNSVTINVPADSNYPAAATHFALYVGALPGQQWSQVASTALGSTATIPAWPLTNNIGVNRSVNDPSSGIVGYANYAAGTGYAQRAGFIESAGYDWRALFGVDQSLSGNQTLLEQYGAQITKLSSSVPVVMSLDQAWNPGLIGTTGGIVFSTTYQCFYVDTGQGNKIFTIDGAYGGLPGPYNPNAPTLNQTGVPIVGHFNSGLA